MLYVYILVAEWVAKIRFSGTRNQPKYGMNASWKMNRAGLFFITPRIFDIFDEFLKFRSPFGGALHFEKSTNNGKSLAKNEAKPCSTSLQPISPWYYRYLKPGFWIPVLPLIYDASGLNNKKNHTHVFMHHCTNCLVSTNIISQIIFEYINYNLHLNYDIFGSAENQN